MKTKGLQKLLSLVVLAFLAGCSTNTNPNSNQPEIGEVTWTLANIDPDFFNNGSLETAFYNFNINVFHPGGIENIKRIQVIQPSSEAFTIFNSETDQYPADFTADHAAFNCLCWLYSASEPHAFELGTYTVKVSLAGDKTLSSKFDIVNPYGQDASSLIYTPEENPAATPQMPSRPMLENFTVDDHGITYNFIQAKSDATYYQLNFFDSDGYFRGSSKLFESLFV